MAERLVTLPAFTARELRVLHEAVDSLARAAAYINERTLADAEPDARATERIAICRSLRTAIAEGLLAAER